MEPGIPKHNMMEALYNPMVPRPYLVSRTRRELRDTLTLFLEPADHQQPFRNAPGQFNMLYIFGVGEVPVSISGDAERTNTLVHTVRAVGAVTEAMCKLKRGDLVGVRGPFGSQWHAEKVTGKDLVIVAGGIGLAPLRPVLYQVQKHRSEYGQVFLLYGARSPEELLYRKEVEQWKKRFDMNVEVTVDRASTDWQGHVGVVTTLISQARFDPVNTTAMLCGPEVMMRFAVMELQKRGVGAENIFVSMERNMKCAIGFCGRCQFGPTFICKDGPILCYDRISNWFGTREV